MTNTTIFKINTKYETRSICDSNCIFSITTIKRTKTMLTFKNWDGEVMRKKIKVSDGVEFVIPEVYSMAPRFRAN